MLKFNSRKGNNLHCWLFSFLFLIYGSVFAQDRTIQGTVLDENGEPLPGASVIVKGTSSGTVTDLDGSFSLSVPSEEDLTLQVSFLGYTAQEIQPGTQSTIEVQMAPDMESLSEVVVVGYGEQKKATLTGSVSQVEGRDIAQSPQPNISNSLAGRFSGLIANNRSGEPGYDGSSISIRGLATTGNNDVLVVVDGVPGQVGGLERLNPNDIESISVLKDASAAVYGNRAANGVILVTTKRGETGKPRVTYSFNQGFSSPTRLPNLADAGTYAEIRNEIAYYNNRQNGLNQLYSQEEIGLFRSGADPLNYPNTNWQRESLQSVALQNQHDLSVRGGSENVRYFASLGMLSQDGLYRNGANQYEQYSFRTNLDADITDRLTVGVSLAGRKESRQFPTEGAGTIFRSIYRAYPTVPAFFPNGLPSSGIENNHPAIMATDEGGVHDNPRYVFNGILRASYELPIDGFSVDGFLSIDESSDRYRNWRTPYTLYNYSPSEDAFNPIVVGGGPNQMPSLEEGHTYASMQVSNIKLNFNKSFGVHHVDAFVGYEQSFNHSHTMGASRFHFPTAETPELSQGGPALSDYDNWGSSYNFSRRSIISRFNYNYQEKYLVEVQARADGSSIFPEGNRYGFFPSISAGYRITEEDWFSGGVADVFDDLKFRVSHGQLGNDNVGQFQFFDNYTFNNRYVVGGEVVTGIDLVRLGNPNITWEVSTKTDIGINAVWLQKFNTEVIFFHQNRSDILTTRNASIPAVSGIVNPFDDESLVPSENIGEVTSHGMEATVGYQHVGAFNFGVSGNFTYARNEVVFMDEAPGVPEHQRQTGRPLNTYLVYRTTGIFQTDDEIEQVTSVPGAQPGDLIYEDINGDGVITADDMYRTELGNIPQITFGLNLNAGYKNFDIAMVFAGQARVRQYVLPESGTVGNYYSSWSDNRWSPNNPQGTHPRVSERASSAVSGGLFPGDFWLQDVSFVRLKNLELGYNFPTAVLDRFGIGNLRLYTNAFNLFTITGVQDFDPEGSSGSAQFYPQQRIINLGVNVSF
ncbi:SusC/RagA family TonB-linked outer membrane protein [Pleomorphovibrio marinus]|uniref:SusC/RagA family TonB-linked outer membrane protein n=1 Tax=Pleomorphovibrio marinus TaxID=2164132 RepID=UPI000E0A598A|nr:TonB-dependent receptor [Pleomorphovibrio marinus]